MTVQEFPKTDHTLINALWEQQVSKLFQELLQAKRTVDSHRPPTKTDIETFLAKSGDFFVVSRLNEIKEYERRIDELRSELSAFATDALHSPANEDERKAARTHFNQIKNKLTASLNSLAHIASHDGEHDIVTWVESALTQIPKLNTTSNNHDLKAMREWLQKHHPEAGIKSRGTIPLEWQRKYYSRTQ